MKNALVLLLFVLFFSSCSRITSQRYTGQTDGYIVMIVEEFEENGPYTLKVSMYKDNFQVLYVKKYSTTSPDQKLEIGDLNQSMGCHYQLNDQNQIKAITVKDNACIYNQQEINRFIEIKDKAIDQFYPKK
jgi:hypothetical protein